MKGCLSALALCLFAGSIAAEPLVLTEDDRWQNITTHVRYLVDPTTDKGIDEISALPESAFQKATSESLNFGVSPGAVWLRLELKNQTKRNIWILELNNARLESVRSFVPAAEGWQTDAVGTKFPVASRLAMHVLPALRLRLPEFDSAVCYVRVEHNGATRFQVQLSTMEKFRQLVTSRTAATFTLAGGILAMVLFNLIIFIMLRELPYLLLAGTIFCFLCFSMALNGSGYLWVWPDAHWWTARSVTTTSMLHHGMLAIFFRQFVRPAKGSNAYRLGTWLSVVFFALALMALTDWTFKYYAIWFAGSLGPLALELGAIHAWRKGYKPAGQFAVAWGIGVAGLMYLTLVNVGVLEHSYLRESAVSVTYLLAIVFFNLSLAERLRLSEKAAREHLEELVRARTRELKHAQEEVEALSSLLPICSSCHKIRDDKGYWQGVEHYLRKHTDAEITHGMCPDCLEKVYPGYSGRMTEFEQEDVNALTPIDAVPVIRGPEPRG